MDTGGDELCRQVAGARQAQAEAMPVWSEALAGAFGGGGGGGDTLTSGEKAELVLGALARRRFLQLGGLTVATGALLAACGKGTEEDNIPSAGLPSPTTGLPERSVDDIVLLRTASSLERSLVSTYDAALKLVTGDIAEALEVFRDHHEAHARQFESITAREGGEPFSEPNPVLQQTTIEPTLKAITAQGDPRRQRRDVIVFAHALENIAASTYQSSVTMLSQPRLRQAAMGVGAVEARHSAVLAKLIEGSIPVAGLETLEAATTTAAPTTTVAATPAPGETTTTTSPVLALPEQGVFQVPGPFGSLAEAVGPNTYVYDDRTLTTTETG